MANKLNDASVNSPVNKDGKQGMRAGGPGMRMGGPGMKMGGRGANDFKKAIGELLNYMKNYWPAIITALIFAAVGTVCSISGPKILEVINKEILRALELFGKNAAIGIFGNIEIDFTLVTSVAIVLLCLYIVSFILNFIQHFIMVGVSAKVSMKMRTEISEKINNLPLSYFDNQSFGDVLSRITNDVDTLGQTLSQSINTFITSITMLVGIVVMMLTISWQLTIVAIVSIPLSMLLITVFVKLSQKYFIRQQSSLGRLNGHIEEIYSAHSVVKIYDAADKEIKEFDKANNDLLDSAYKSQFLSGLMMPVMSFVSNLAYVAICVLGGWMALKDVTFIASIIAFIAYVRQLNQPISQFAQVMGSLQSGAAAAERVFEFLKEPEQADESQKTAALNNVQGAVEFKDVVFGYTPEKEIIHGFSCKVEPGQKIAIVGPTGAGKTTMINLLMRFYEVNSGEITIDGISTAGLKRGDVRKQFGMVLQDTWLFEGSIRDNLAYGKQDASQDDIETAAKAAKIHHYITTLPGSYNAVLNEDTALSQGQKQLMTIARAMIQNAPMLILDEATSSVDTRTEVLIQEAMDKLMKGRTSFIIAHRLSTIRNADLILVMKDGNIIETGDHDNLMAQNGFYSDLYNSQFAKETSV